MNEEATFAMSMLSEDDAMFSTSSAQDIFEKISLLLGTYSLVSTIVSIAISILTIIALWRIFKKAGEKGWKVLIPIYNVYIFTKVAWTGSMFPIMLILSIIGGFAANYFSGLVSILIAMITLVSLFLFYIMMIHKLSKRFGHGLGFTLGLLLFYPFFIMIIGFGKSKYDYNRAIR